MKKRNAKSFHGKKQNKIAKKIFVSNKKFHASKLNMHACKTITHISKKNSEISSKCKITKLLITGSPATGKTTLAKDWCAKYGWHYICINDVVKEKKLYSKTDKDGAKIAKLAPLKKELNLQIKNSKNSVVIDGHLGCEVHLNIDKIIVLRLDPKELNKRLAARNYEDEKIRQNLAAEALDYCTILCHKNYEKAQIFQIDATSKTREQLILLASQIIFCQKIQMQKIDWSNYFLK